MLCLSVSLFIPILSPSASGVSLDSKWFTIYKRYAWYVYYTVGLFHRFLCTYEKWAERCLFSTILRQLLQKANP